MDASLVWIKSKLHHQYSFSYNSFFTWNSPFTYHQFCFVGLWCKTSFCSSLPHSCAHPLKKNCSVLKQLHTILAHTQRFDPMLKNNIHATWVRSYAIMLLLSRCIKLHHSSLSSCSELIRLKGFLLSWLSFRAAIKLKFPH